MTFETHRDLSEHVEHNHTTVCVDLDGRGTWEVAIPDRPDHLVCQTFADARRVAYAYATRRRACELIVRDAYHRVLQRELLDGVGDCKRAVNVKPTCEGG